LKKLLFLVLLVAAGAFFYRSYVSGPPRTFENPVYGEIRVDAKIEGRDLEMALFVRSADENDCQARALRTWAVALIKCPTCQLHPTRCQAQLPARYARLFNDEPIPSTYLSASAGNAGERDGRLVVYGLTDQEGAAACEVIRTMLMENFRGTAHCVKASGG
jgi:hypothetical protein